MINMEPGEFIVAKMPGYILPSYNKRENYKFKMWMPFKSTGKINYNIKGFFDLKSEDRNRVALGTPTMKVFNERIAQSQAASAADFFKEKGFVLSKNETQVKNWNADYNNHNNDLTKFYHSEVD